MAPHRPPGRDRANLAAARATLPALPLRPVPTHRIRRGLRLPLGGAPMPTIDRTASGRHVGLLGADALGLRPVLRVQVGDHVRRGEVLFEDKGTPGVRFTSPATGTVVAIHRGARRRFESVVVELSDEELAAECSEGQCVDFVSYRRRHPRDLDREGVVALLLESGEWTALRRRPFSRVPDPAEVPASIFVTAIDTHPLAPPIGPMLQGREDDLERGLHALAVLTEGPIFVCVDGQTDLGLPPHDRFRLERFEGPHPAGTVGVHIHHLDPVDRDHVVWHVGIQDLLAIGALFGSGRLQLERIVSLAGPAVRRPRLLRVRRGADVDALCAGELADGELRVISGSVFAGRSARGEVCGFLGRYHQSVCALFEQREREFFGWALPGRLSLSFAPTLLSRVLRRRDVPLGSTTGGAPRAIVPIGVYEEVLPMDLEPTFLLKAIMMRDAEQAERLGCLELDEEDLALCAFVCPAKSDFGHHLRDVLTVLEKEQA